ncbi:hypothetical protein [Mesorhizobium sp. M0768]|uniref:hypothetical protein n=1 Tax=Mesorhizobium sp. M0768 TaxID=2956996 RepID=UPI003336F438
MRRAVGAGVRFFAPRMSATVANCGALRAVSVGDTAASEADLVARARVKTWKALGAAR